MGNWAETQKLIYDIDSPQKALRIIAMFSHSGEEFAKISREYLQSYHDLQEIFKEDYVDFERQTKAHKDYWQKIRDLEYFIWTHMDSEGGRCMERCENDFDF